MIYKGKLFLLFIVFGLFGCGPSAIHTGLQNFSYHNRARLQLITPGMEKDDVLKAMDSNAKAIMEDGMILSNPFKTETFSNAEGTTIEVLFYYTEVIEPDKLVNEDELTPIVFTKGKVSGWGKSYLNGQLGK
tara:strand:- start:80 stop:475 length:396 start_codon:yes stop_codon:yes gene_type:complete